MEYSCTVGYIYDVMDRIQFASFFVVVIALITCFMTFVTADNTSMEEFMSKVKDKNNPLKKVIIAGLIALFLVIFLP